MRRQQGTYLQLRSRSHCDVVTFLLDTAVILRQGRREVSRSQLALWLHKPSIANTSSILGDDESHVFVQDVIKMQMSFIINYRGVSKSISGMPE